jgi:hypothetical protein
MKTDSLTNYYNHITTYQSAQLLFAAIRLDIFSHTDSPVTSQKLAVITGYPEKNLGLLLLALSSCGHLEQDGDYYANTKASAEYLSKKSPHYIGETLLFREEMTSLQGMEEKVRCGPETQQPHHDYNFAALARVVVPEMYATGRVQAFQSEAGSIFPDPSASLRMLDLGGGSGILAIEFAQQYPNSEAYVFEHPSVAPTTEEIIAEHAAAHRVSVLAGDFNKDDIGSGYDFIVASGILDFAAGDLQGFLAKIANALSDQGYLLLVGRYSQADSPPTQNIVSWLSGYMAGVNPPPLKEQVEAALEKTQLSHVRTVDSGRFQGVLYQKGVSHE